ncbi:ISXO2-like transposase domain-containing protein [Hymenobacter psychrophilus]|uniref:ISXO2-like transposase domain-containing protein n=1 Tax=Hymenobacter psychrophilus TaxID=651662 RepID=A0A1H3PHH5_9BACT|nr:ISXO2-like transposase domain-containing protein [Hymenobacter psychrophilus]
MQPTNHHYGCSKIPTRKFRYLLRLFALDLMASDTVRLTGLGIRSVNDIYLSLRQRLNQLCPIPAELGGALELDESYFGPRRVLGKRGRGASSRTIVLGPFQRAGRVYTEIVPDCFKATLPGIIRGKIDLVAMVNTDGWRGYDGLVGVCFDRHYRVLHSQDEYVQDAVHINGIESF